MLIPRKVKDCYVGFFAGNSPKHYLTTLPGQTFHECTRCGMVVCSYCKTRFNILVGFLIVPFSILDLPFISTIVVYLITWMEPSLAVLIPLLTPLLERYRIYKLPSRVIKMYSLLVKMYSLLVKIYNYVIKKSKRN